MIPSHKGDLWTRVGKCAGAVPKSDSIDRRSRAGAVRRWRVDPVPRLRCLPTDDSFPRQSFVATRCFCRQSTSTTCVTGRLVWSIYIVSMRLGRCDGGFAQVHI